ncbi:DNA binding protein [Aureococcus anophagefferens]|nr:DNA binding protein [Aureococcus anophagefferens]
MKILCCGDVEGRFEETFKRVAKIEAANGPFDALFCVGAFFAGDAVAEVPEAPVPTWVLELPAGSAVAAGDSLGPNVTYLGACGVTTVSERAGGSGAKVMSVAFAGGAGSVAGLLDACGAPGFMGCDAHAVGDDRVAEAAVACRPRYHFAGTHGAFWARAPYRNARDPPAHRKSHVTRFVALGQAAKSKDKRRKWLHAVDVDPIPYCALAALAAEPAGCTDSPYVCLGPSVAPTPRMAALAADEARDSAKRKNAPSALRWGDVSGGGKRPRRDEGASTTLFVGGLPPYCDDAKLAETLRAALGDRYPDDARRECWFCLASPGCETHLVAAVKDACYVCQPKGPLVDAHALVVPIAHASTRAGLEPAVRDEMDATADGLAATFRAKLAGAHTVAFERVADTKKGVYHVHRQVIPVPRRGDGDAAKLLADFRDAADRGRFALAPVDGPFLPPADARVFLLDVYDGDSGAKTRLACVQAKDAPDRFAPLHFGRDLLARALGEPHKAHWKACEKSKQDETALCERLKGLISE